MAVAVQSDIDKIADYLGNDADDLLDYEALVNQNLLTLPGPDFIDRVFADSDRTIPVLNNLQRLYSAGRLSGTGYISILPIDQGIEHSGGASFAPNPIYFDPENIVKLAIEGGCNAVATTLGVLGMVARQYAHKIPFILKFNHNQLLTYPSQYDQVVFGQVEQAWEMGCAGVGATIYFGLARIQPTNCRNQRSLCPRTRTGAIYRVVVLFAKLGICDRRHRLPRSRGPHGTGQPPRRHYWRGHHQTKIADQQRRLHSPEFWTHPRQSLYRTLV